MSTNDVPGAKAANNDTLAAMCWAEHDDGSLILVEGTEGGTVVYSVFDTSKDPIIEYRDAMPQAGFEKEFSWDGKGDKWTWHDKTAFPWDRVMQSFPSGTRYASADGLQTAAQRVAGHRNLDGIPRTREELQHLAGEIRAATDDLINRIQNAIGNLPP